jgi:RNAse (barnase) inhibitor barstar
MSESKAADRIELVSIDLSQAETSAQLQALLAESLGFPGWYGHNWDAFWEAITGLVAMPRRVLLIGWAAFQARLPEDARIMRQTLDDMAAEFPALAAKVVYR